MPCYLDLQTLGQHPLVQQLVTAPVPGAERQPSPVPRVALVFGREELGLSDDEVASCDAVCSIPIGRLQVRSRAVRVEEGEPVRRTATPST